jgi:hypothetical protein
MTNQPRAHRIVIGATCYADASSVIEIGCFLAESTRGEIQAVLIEEDAVYGLSSLPRAQVTLIGGSSRPVTPEAMLDAFRRDAAAYEKAIRETAAKRAVRWSFEKRRGEFPLVLDSDLSSGDLIVFGYQALQRGRGEILVVDYANDMDVSLVELASKVAREMKLPLHVVLLRKSPDAAILVSEHSRGRMQRLATNLTIMDQEDNLRALLENIRRGRAATVMISASLTGDVGLSQLLDAARCPVIVYGS